MKFKKFYIISSKLMLVAFMLSLIAYYFFKNDYFFYVPVTFTDKGYPIIDVQIGQQALSLQVDIGSRFPLFLKQKVLNEIEKTHIGNDQWRDLEGGKYIADIFSIPNVNIKDYKLKGIIAYQREDESLEDYGKIGKFLGEELNLLMDFPNNRIIGCKNLKKLQKCNINTSNWRKIPFEMTRAGVTIDVETDIGSKKMALCTTANVTFIRSNLVKEKNHSSQGEKNSIFHSSIYKIGNVELNGVDFYLVDITSELNEVDGFIGMDFFKKHAVFIDYKNKCLYIDPPDEYFVRFPVTFNNFRTPCTLIKIEEETLPVQIDLGSPFYLSLNEKILNKIKKTSYGTSQWMDFKGTQYQSITYKVPNIKIGKVLWKDAIVNQDRDDFHVNTRIKGEFSEILGSIGSRVLEKYNLFLDFNNDCVYICRTLSELKREGLVSDKLIKAPFILHNDGILLEIETEIGLMRFILDTGSTRTALRAGIVGNEYILNTNNSPVPIFITSKFIIGGQDFTEGEILLLEISPEYGYDGYLGMDFLKIFPIYIDYFNRFIYIDIGNRN